MYQSPRFETTMMLPFLHYCNILQVYHNADWPVWKGIYLNFDDICTDMHLSYY